MANSRPVPAVAATQANTAPAILIIEANEAQTQPAARLLTLANFRVIVTVTPEEAYRRCFGNHLPLTDLPRIVMAGHISLGDRAAFTRLMQQLSQARGFDVPILPLAPLDDEQLLLANAAISPFFHVFSQTCRQWLKQVWDALPDMRIANTMQEYALVLDALPARGQTPRVSRENRARNRHFRLALSTARQIIPAPLWETLLSDVGLSRYRIQQQWPPDDDARLVPLEYWSCLHQAVAFSNPPNPDQSLRRWGDASAQILLDQRSSLLTRQVVRLFTGDRSISLMLRRFTEELDAARGESLHTWTTWPDGSYWLIHYSNLYIYGRGGLASPACQVWLGALDALLRYVRLSDTWEAREVECSGQTHTGHCVFVLHKRGTDANVVADA